MKQPSIFVVEDEFMLRKMIAMDLQDEGADVSVAQDGQEAIDMLNSLQPDLILLDLLMPKRDGFEVMRHLRSAGRHTPIIVLSNVSSEDMQQRCRELGAVDFIVKSELDTGDLWPRIQEYLA